MERRASFISEKEESEIITRSLPYVKKLMKSAKLTKSEKLSVLEDLNIDVAAYLESVGEEI